MTFFEHAMLGSTLALAAGLHRRFGWRIVIMAGVAAMLPDWDGLTLIFGSSAYDLAHRVWGHNLLVAGCSGGLVGVAECFWNVSDRVRQRLARFAPSLASPTPLSSPDGDSRTPALYLTWFLIGAVASFSHLAADLVYSSHPRMQDWPLRLLWPFSRRDFAFPIIHWGDLGATIIFVAEMFAVYFWPSRIRVIASATLTAVVGYILVRAGLR